MRGRNQLIINQETLNAAVEKYLADTLAFTNRQKVHDVRRINRRGGPWFAVDIEHIDALTGKPLADRAKPPEKKNERQQSDAAHAAGSAEGQAEPVASAGPVEP